MYALVDCNNFYCSCERVFNPRLQQRPVIVLSNNDGCAIARSEEAKALGIDMAQPVFMIEAQLKAARVAVFSSNYTLYGDMSDRVMNTLASFVPQMEIYSIDEAFLDLSQLAYEDLNGLGQRLRDTVLQHTGIPVSVGIAPTKTLAKMANRFSKKNVAAPGLFRATAPSEIRQLLIQTAVEDIWGIGRQQALLLHRNGFHTAADFTAAPVDWVRRQMSVVGLRLLHELQGQPAIAWTPEAPAKKNICTSRSFGRRITRFEDLETAVANFAAACALKLRRQHSVCEELEVLLQTNPHKTEERQYRRSIHLDLPHASNDTGLLIAHALKGLRLIYRDGYRYMKAGVRVGRIRPAGEVQASLFEAVDPERNHRVMKAMDEINRSFGKNRVRMAIQGFDQRYHLKAAHLSPQYTTNIHQVLKVKI
ncbi:Y-family DNA polymerase [Niabella terrae]